MSTTTLPRLDVYGSAPDPFYGLGDNASYNSRTNPFAGPSARHPRRNPAITAWEATANGRAYWDAISAGQSAEAMQRFFEGLSARDATFARQQLDVWGRQFMRYQAAGGARPAGSDAYAMSPALTPKLAQLAGVWIFERRPEKPAVAYDFWGSPVVALAGIAYWVLGGGATRNIHIESLGLDLQAHNLRPLQEALNNPGLMPGTYAISGDFEYNTFDGPTLRSLWAAGLMGRVSGNVTGTLTLGEGGNWHFTGSYAINPDSYDAYVSNRTPNQEAMTRFLGSIGNVMGHANYDIVTHGRKSIELTGRR